MASDTPAAGPSLSTARQNATIGVLLLMYVFAYMDRNVLALMVDQIKHSLAISDVQFSLVHGMAFGMFYAVFGLPMGYIVDRFSKRWVLFSGISFWSLATIACGLARSFPALAFARFGVGAGEATLVPAAYSTIARILPRDRIAMGIAVFSLGSTLGSAIAIGFGGYLIAALTGMGGLHLPLLGHLEPWQGVFVIIGAPGLLVALLSFTVPEAARPERGVAADAPMQPLWPYVAANWRYLLLMNGSLAFVTINAYAFTSWLPAFLLRRFHEDVSWVGLAVSAITVTGSLGFLASGYISDRLFRGGRKDAHILPALYCTIPVMLASVVGFHFSDSVWLSIACAVVTHIGLAIANAMGAHIQLTAPAALRGRLAAITVASQHLCGLSFGPLMVALVTDKIFHDPGRVGDSVAIVAVVMGLLSLLMLRAARSVARQAVDRMDSAPAS